MRANTRRVARLAAWLALAGALVLLLVRWTMGRVVAGRGVARRARDTMRRANRRVFNRVMRQFAGRRWVPWLALVKHRGRQSGRQYTTPVVATATGERVVIPLVYGDDVDWLRNVLRAGRFEVVLSGEGYSLVEPILIDAARGRVAFAPPLRFLLWAAGTRRYLQARPAP